SNAAISDILDTIAARHVMVVADSCYSGTLSRTSVPTFDPAEADRGKWDAWGKAVAKGRARTVLSSGGVMPVPAAGSGRLRSSARGFLAVLPVATRRRPGHRLLQEVSTALALPSLASPLAQAPECAPLRYARLDSGPVLFLPTGRGPAIGP